MSVVEKNYVKNSGALNTTTGRGIIVAGLSNCVIRDNTVDGATEYGIRMFAGASFPKTNNNIIENNYVKNVGVDTTKSLVYSIYLYAESTGETKDTVVLNNTIEDVGLVSANDVGITSGGSNGSAVSGNIISGTQGTGINISTFVDGYNVIRGNRISGIDSGVTSSYNVSNGDHESDLIDGNLISVSTIGISVNAVPYPRIQNNVITVSDTTTVTAFGIESASSIEESVSNNRVTGGYTGLQKTGSSRGLIFNNRLTGYGAGGDINVPIEQQYTGQNVFLTNSTVSTTDTYYGIYNQNIKTAGASDNSDTMWGLFNDIRINQSGGTVGTTRGLYTQALLLDGTIDPELMGIEAWGRMEGGTITDLYGAFIHAFVDAGTVGDDIFGSMIDVDIDASVTSIGGDVYGLYIKIDVDKDPVGKAYGLYVDDLSNVDYAIFTKSTAPTKLNGLIEYSSLAGITAATSQVQGNGPLTNTINIVTTVANANDVVTLPDAVQGLSVTVHNRGANTLQIFPASSDAINGGSVNASVTLATNTRVVFDAGDAINWYS